MLTPQAKGKRLSVPKSSSQMMRHLTENLEATAIFDEVLGRLTRALAEVLFLI